MTLCFSIRELKKVLIICLTTVLFGIGNLHAQDAMLSGTVMDQNGGTLIGATLSWINHPNQGTAADINGAFRIMIPEGGDTLEVSYIGFESFRQFIPPDKSTELNIRLGAGIQMKTFEVSANKALAEEFSTLKMEKLDIYFNPVSAGDPLRAISLLPSSTNSDETANPELRGASSDLSTIQINGVPISNPVKASALNGVGYFSLINPELVETMTVYPSNPPLYVGHSVGGLVDVITPEKNEIRTTDLSISLASVGALLSRPIQDGKGYAQVYGNRQFSDVFKWANGNRFDFLKSFSNTDLGINTSLDLGNNLRLKYTTYAIQENNEVAAGIFNFYGNALGDQFRNFHVLNLSKTCDKTVYNLSAGYDYRDIEQSFGTMNLDQSHSQYFLSMDMTNYNKSLFIYKRGISLRSEQIKVNDIYPAYYSSFGSDQLHLLERESSTNHLFVPELYHFLKYEHKKWVLSTGVRGGLNLKGNDSQAYLSGQLNVNYRINKISRILFGIGHYNKILAPALSSNTNHLKADQISLEYSMNNKCWEVLLAGFYKIENYERSLWSVINSGVLPVRKKYIKGAEVFVKYTPNDKWFFSVSNNYLDTRSGDDQSIQLNPSFKYMLKANIQFTGKPGTIGMAYMNRPGRFFTLNNESLFIEELNDYIPDFSNGITENGNQFGTYSNLSINYSKFWSIKKRYALIGFVSLSNALNSSNERNLYYNVDYSEQFYEYYQPMTIYAGIVFKL